MTRVEHGNIKFLKSCSTFVIGPFPLWIPNVVSSWLFRLTLGVLLRGEREGRGEKRIYVAFFVPVLVNIFMCPPLSPPPSPLPYSSSSSCWPPSEEPLTYNDPQWLLEWWALGVLGCQGKQKKRGWREEREREREKEGRKGEWGRGFLVAWRMEFKDEWLDWPPSTTGAKKGEEIQIQLVSSSSFSSPFSLVGWTDCRP